MYAKRQGDAEEEVDTPMLLHIPAGLVDWLTEERRTPWDLHKKIQKIVADSGITTTPDAVKMSLGWCLKAGQIACGAAGSVTLDPSGVFTQDPNTNEWLKQRLNTTLGVEEQPQQQVVWAPPAHMPTAQQYAPAPAGPTQSRDKEVFTTTEKAAISGGATPSHQDNCRRSGPW